MLVVAVMGKRREKPTSDQELEPIAPTPDDKKLTTVKAYKRFAKMISRLAKLTGRNQQDVLMDYEPQVSSDYRAALTARLLELRDNRHRQE